MIQNRLENPLVAGNAIVFLDVRMIFVRREVSGYLGNMLREPPAMAGRASRVRQAVPQADRGGDGVQVEAPRAEERAPVVPPAFVSSRPPVKEFVRKVLRDFHAVGGIGASPITPQFQPPFWPRQPDVHLRRLGPELRPRGVPVFEEDPDFLPVRVVHSLEEVKARGIKWPERGNQADRFDRIGQERCGGQGIRAAAGKPPRGNPADTQLAQNGLNVRRAVGDRPARHWRRPAVAGPVIAD
jgi:hypothetical protein